MSVSNQIGLNSATALYLIDSRISLVDRQRFIKGLPPDSAWELLEDDRDALEQIRDIISGFSGLNSLHLIGHGAPGSLLLGNGSIDIATLHQQAIMLGKLARACRVMAIFCSMVVMSDQDKPARHLFKS